MKPVDKRGASKHTAGREKRPQSLSEFALAQTRVRLKRVITEIGRATRNPKKTETAHDLRVAIRRFTQCLRTFDELLDPGPARKMRKKLRKLMKLCGAKRDYDVGLEVIAEAGLPANDPAFARFQEHREHRMRELARSLEKKHNWDVTGHWRKQLALRKQLPGVPPPAPPSAPGPARLGDGHIEWDGSAAVSENVRPILPRLAGEFFDDGEATVAVLGDYELLHPFRLRGKRFRYTLEVFAPCYGEELDSKLRALRGLQDRMGAINDCIVVLKLPGMNRTAAAAVRKLLALRDAAFRKYWRKTFSPRSQESWKRLLANPKRS